GGGPTASSTRPCAAPPPCCGRRGSAPATAWRCLNRRAQAHLRCENRLEVVPGATHLFEEPGALDRVAELARDWFTAHLAAPGG
ncbi:phosphoribosyltransferase, partial [Streptomyces sp. NPDC002530]